MCRCDESVHNRFTLYENLFSAGIFKGVLRSKNAREKKGEDQRKHGTLPLYFLIKKKKHYGWTKEAWAEDWCSSLLYTLYTCIYTYIYLI